MEVTHVGVTTRARAMTMGMKETEGYSGVVKRRKVGHKKLRSPLSTFVQTKPLDRDIYVNSPPEKDPSDLSVPSLKSTGSMEKLKVEDLEESFETETTARDKLDGIESIKKTEYKAESGQLGSTTKKQSSVTVNSCRTVSSPEKMPPKVELEAYFTAAEEDLRELFKNKYNYDIVNDIPLKGRYEWVQITPGK